MATEAKLTPDGKRKFGMRDSLAYAAGDLGCNMSFALKSVVQTFWLVFMAMDTNLLSILLLVVQIWDAVNDPLIGSMIDADRRKYKYGKFKTYIFVGAAGLLFGGALIFLPFPTAPTVVKCILYIAGYIIWDAFYTIANVPYGSMLSLVTEDLAERSSLSTWRSIGSAVGNIVGMIVPLIIWQKVKFDGTTNFLSQIEMPEGFTEADFMRNPITGKLYEIGEQVISPATGKDVQILLGNRMFLVAIVMGILGFIAFMLMLKFITIRVDENTVKTNDTQKFNVIKAFANFMTNRPAVGATLAAMGMFIGMQSAGTATTIMFATSFGAAEMSGIVTAIGFVPMFFFMPFIKKLVVKFGKKECSAVGAAVSLLGGLLMLIFPLIKNSTVSMIMYIAALAVFGFGMGVYTCVSWALMADAIDYNEWKTGKREEGVVYSLHSFFRKLAQGIGPALALVIMGWIGYDSKLGTIGQSAETASNMCWLVAGMYLFSAIVMFVGLAVVYNLDKKTVATMTEELAIRHAANAEMSEE